MDTSFSSPVRRFTGAAQIDGKCALGEVSIDLDPGRTDHGLCAVRTSMFVNARAPRRCFASSALAHERDRHMDQRHSARIDVSAPALDRR
jgi:hypothetical protein